MKFSIITVVYNGESFISDCIRSVITQSYPKVEYIVIDGGSTDGTIERIKSFGAAIDKFISEKDLGIYDAMNKGLSMATGDIVGILNADDFFSDTHVLEQIAQAFSSTECEVIYGDLFYVNRRNTGQVVRKWIGQPFNDKLFSFGWMPAHPTFYARRELFGLYGNYDLSYGSAADYELMLRFLFRYKVKAAYLPHLMVRMRAGGISNRSLLNRFAAIFQDYRAMRANSIRFPVLTALLKPIRKVSQFSLFFNFKLNWFYK